MALLKICNLQVAMKGNSRWVLNYIFFFLFLHIEEKNVYPVTHSRSAQPAGTRPEGAASLKLSISFKDGAINSQMGSVLLQSCFMENVSGHCEEITSTFNHLQK